LEAFIFSTNKPIIDRLNRLDGKELQWLPQDDKLASNGFWNLFNVAENYKGNENASHLLG
jgi:hypothetical protein